MLSKKLLWRIYIPHLLIILISLGIIAWYVSASVKYSFLEEMTTDLRIRAFIAEKLLGKDFPLIDESTLHSLCQKISSQISARLTVILPSGIVIGDSEGKSNLMDNYADRSEIRNALAGIPSTSMRFSPILQENMIYVAIPVERDGHVIGAVRTSRPITAISRTLRAIYLQIFTIGLIIAVLTALISLIISHSINRPICEIKKGAEHFASGDLEHQIFVADGEEIAQLAETMNKMADQLNERIRTIIQQRNELEAVLSNMVEAVIVFDKEEHIIKLNQAASRLFGLGTNETVGRNIQEMIRNSNLLRFVTKTLSSIEPVEDDIIFNRDTELFLQAHGTILRDPKGNNNGALVVLDDVTRLKTLENIRRDFVANVSHELKTPITSIKGFVETLREGAIDDRDNSQRFLEIILKHVDRLNAIIDDLLSLSRIEQESEREHIIFENDFIKQVLISGALVCNNKAAEKEIEIKINCQDGLLARINPPLLEQAVVNLIDNAIKYSNRKSIVWVDASRTDQETIISVKDRGCGIPGEHLCRIFERFYRVDKARSRKLGGTGLGLAIVKHIIHAHGGHVSVKSTPGQGSTFTIHLPL